MITYLLDWAHKSTETHLKKQEKHILKTREMSEYLSNKLNVFWLECMKNVNAFVRIESHARCLKGLRKEK